MRVFKGLLASAGLLVARAATAAASIVQDPPIKVEVHTSETHTVWYTNPMWLAIGGIVVLLIIVLAIMAGRNKEGNTTVVR